MRSKKKSKWKVVGFSFLTIVILAVAAFGYEYYTLQPKNHFKSIPVVGSGNSGVTQNTTKQENAGEPIFNVLLMGSDARPGQKIGHSDTMLLVHVDLNQNKYNAISIPRDTRVHLDGYGYTKLTSVQYIIQATKGPKQGVEAAVTAVSELTGVPINYYAETSFEGLQSMVNTVGSIDMNIPYDVKINNQVINPGIHNFDGKMVLALTRERYSLPNGDFGRQRLQLEALKGIAKQALKPSNVSNLPALINSLSDFVIATNMSKSDMVSIGLASKNFNPDTQLTYHQLPAQGKTLYDDILKANNAEQVVDQQKLKEIISANF
jgi:polyisoprenyl-teichoic acid--peptidoglycan teichoic acid transferase